MTTRQPPAFTILYAIVNKIWGFSVLFFSSSNTVAPLHKYDFYVFLLETPGSVKPTHKESNLTYNARFPLKESHDPPAFLGQFITGGGVEWQTVIHVCKERKRW